MHGHYPVLIEIKGKIIDIGTIKGQVVFKVNQSSKGK
jgi:hypothetical protein